MAEFDKGSPFLWTACSLASLPACFSSTPYVVAAGIMRMKSAHVVWADWPALRQAANAAMNRTTPMNDPTVLAAAGLNAKASALTCRLKRRK